MILMMKELCGVRDLCSVLFSGHVDSHLHLGIEGEDESWDFGTGAGFYVDATAQPWANNYRMYSYVTKELPALVKANFNVNEKASIMGHSMGGHGALICFLKNPELFESVSAFAPICNPVNCPWGQKAFAG